MAVLYPLTALEWNHVQEALKNVPGIALNGGEGGTHGDNVNTIFMDGANSELRGTADVN
jgi:outer membrane receptor for monomeric catechols